MQLVVVMAVRKAVSAATITFTATSMTFFFMIHLLSIYDFRLLISNIRLPTSNSRWDRYLGMTAAMTQVPVPTVSKTTHFYMEYIG